MSEHLIKVENLTLSYENVTVVRELSFAVESGDYLCIVGENGSGKSTLVKSLLSLKKPVGGSITFGGGLRRNVRELSGGQQQRVLLARALCATSKLLLLDEPVSGLDPMVTAEMYELIADINRSGVTVVMVTHDINAALKYAGRILCMRQGLTRESWFFGTPEEFLTSSASDFLKGGAVNG